MRDDDLRKLLHVAEAGVAAVEVDREALAARVRVRRQQSRGRRMRLAASVPLVLLMAALGAWRLVPRGPWPEVDSQPLASATPAIDTSPIDTETELRKLAAEAEQHAARARVLMAERARRLALIDNDPLAELREHVDLVAYRLIVRADALQAEMRASPDAIEMYQRVIRDFPNTYSAEVAHERLLAAGLPGVES